MHDENINELRNKGIGPSALFFFCVKSFLFNGPVGPDLGINVGNVYKIV